MAEPVTKEKSYFFDRQDVVDSLDYDRDTEQPDKHPHGDTVHVQTNTPFVKPLGSKVTNGIIKFPA